jgi:MiaB-like tRNA modifying enzyme
MSKVYIETYGCSENINESEIMAGLLERSGFEIVKNEKNADLIIVNTCYVKTPTEQKIFFRLKEINEKYPKKKLIVSGCMPEKIGNRLRKTVPRASFVSTHHITDIPRAVEKVLNGKIIEMVGESEKIKLCLPKVRSNDLINIVPISSGCNSSCSYCCVRLAKGKLFSYPKDKIIKEITAAVKNGCKEIWLTSQDNASYGMDLDENLPSLINDISKIKGQFFVRIGMMNPKNVLPILSDLIESYKSEKVYKFLHLPLQSGDNEVLRKMNRGHDVNEFEKIIDSFRKELRMQIWTDVIVGYPGETEEQFNNTLIFINKIKPDWTNVSKYGHRPLTESSKLKSLDVKTVNDRSKIISEESRKISYKNREEWVGWEGRVLISKRGKEKNQWFGRNTSYEPVVVENKDNILAKLVKVKIENTTSSCLFGKII